MCVCVKAGLDPEVMSCVRTEKFGNMTSNKAKQKKEEKHVSMASTCQPDN